MHMVVVLSLPATQGLGSQHHRMWSTSGATMKLAGAVVGGPFESNFSCPI